MEGLILSMIYLSVLGAPFVGFFISSGPYSLKALLFTAIGCMATISLAMTLDIRFSWQPLNAMAWGIWYLGYCVLVFSLLRLKPRWLGRLLTFVGTVPMLALAAISVLGMMVLFFVAGDLMPQHRQSQDGLVCTVYTSGNATTAYNYHDVHLTKPWPWLPLLERRVDVNRILDDGQSLQQSCEQALQMD